MKKELLRKNLIAIVMETLKEQFANKAIQFINLELTGSERNRIVRVFLDKQGGITLDDCAEFSRSLSVVLDVRNPFKSPYTLEVSSPGNGKKKIL